MKLLFKSDSIKGIGYKKMFKINFNHIRQSPGLEDTAGNDQLTHGFMLGN